MLHYSGAVVDPDGQERIQEQALSAPFRRQGRAQQMMRLSKQYTFAASALERIRPDITYSRYLFPAWGAWKIVNHCGKLVFEVNSDDSAEYAAKNTLTGIFNKMFRNTVLRTASGLVFVTRELAHSQAFSAFTKTRTVIANGVDCMHFPFLLNPANASPQLGFIGSPGQSWHGLDKLKVLAELLVDCTMHVIGPGEQECRGLWGRVPPNVVMHGYLGETDAQRLMAKMDVGISTLALHRNKMDEACPLKVRQYLAQGLPVIAASEDTDILSDQNFYLRLPNSEGNISPHAKRIADFVRLAFGNIGMREGARKFAMNKMAVEGKEAERLRFFESILKAP